MSQVPLNAIRAFDAVVRTGSFKAAAETLCVTQSAVSHQVRHLEDWLGRPLFDRSGPRPRLLPEGEDLARVAALSLDGIAAALCAAGAAWARRATGHCGDSIGGAVLAHSAARGVRAAHPASICGSSMHFMGRS